MQFNMVRKTRTTKTSLCGIMGKLHIKRWGKGGEGQGGEEGKGRGGKGGKGRGGKGVKGHKLPIRALESFHEGDIWVHPWS